MQNVIQRQDTILITGDVIETDVPYEEYLSRFDGQHVEWINGAVIQMSPVTEEHSALSIFLIVLFDCFLSATTGGRLFHDPMTMRPLRDLPGRLPDMQIILPENLHIVKDNEVGGAADLVVEIVSPDSQRHDRIENSPNTKRAA